MKHSTPAWPLWVTSQPFPMGKAFLFTSISFWFILIVSCPCTTVKTVAPSSPLHPSMSWGLLYQAVPWQGLASLQAQDFAFTEFCKGPIGPTLPRVWVPLDSSPAQEHTRWYSQHSVICIIFESLDNLSWKRLLQSSGWNINLMLPSQPLSHIPISTGLLNTSQCPCICVYMCTYMPIIILIQIIAYPPVYLAYPVHSIFLKNWTFFGLIKVY